MAEANSSGIKYVGPLYGINEFSCIYLYKADGNNIMAYIIYGDPSMRLIKILINKVR